MEQETGKERYTPMGQEAESETYQVDMDKIRMQLDAEDKVIEYLAGEIAKERKKPAFLQNQARIDKCIDTIAKLKNHKTEYSQEELKAQANALLTKARAKEAAETAAAPVPARHYRLRPVLVAVILLVVVCLCGATACGVIPSLKNWFLKLIDMPAGTEIQDYKTTYLHNGEIIEYRSVEELLKQENVSIYYPNNLSDIYVKEIKRTEVKGKDTLYLRFNLIDIDMMVIMDYNESLEVSDSYQTYNLDGISVYYWEDVALDRYFAIFIDDGNYYSIATADFELLNRILDHMKES